MVQLIEKKTPKLGIKSWNCGDFTQLIIMESTILYHDYNTFFSYFTVLAGDAMTNSDQAPSHDIRHFIEEKPIASPNADRGQPTTKSAGRSLPDVENISLPDGKSVGPSCTENKQTNNKNNNNNNNNINNSNKNNNKTLVPTG